MVIIDGSSIIGKKRLEKVFNYRLRPESYGMKLINVDQITEYYKYLREEIQREDVISVHRISSMLTFQGFLISGVGLVMTGAWMPKEYANLSGALMNFRESLLLLFGIVGLVAALWAARGIRAACRALDVAKDEWEEILELYHSNDPSETDTIDDYSDPGVRRFALYPRTYGIRTDPGGKYGNMLPYGFMAIWVIYCGLCFFFLLPEITNW